MKMTGKGSLRKKLILVMLPVVILSYLITFLVTFFNTRKILQEDASEQMTFVTASVNNEMSAEINRVLGIMENVQTSVEKSCSTPEEIKDYIYGVADAYTDIIPFGIYCGLTNGTYIDKMWTPDGDWVMEERPWYQEGLLCDEVTFGEMYLDANTNQYIISAFANVRNDSGQVIGVVCADITMDKLAEILTSSKVFEDGYIYAIDKVTGMVFGNSKETEKNGLLIQDLTDSRSEEIVSLMEAGTYNTVVSYDNRYYCLSEVAGSNYVTVCCATKDDVEADLKSVQTSSLLTSLFGVIVLCLAIFIALSFFLNPISGIMGVIERMQNLDLTQRARSSGDDEFGAMANSMNMFADNLHGVMGDMKNAITEIDDKADINASISSEMSSMAEQQNDALSKLMATMADLSMAINDIADNTTTLTERVVDTNEATTLVEAKVDETIHFVDTGREEMAKMTITMSQVSDISESLRQAVLDVEQGLNGINAMVNVINDIADQTSLLSLNASIEAARAGERGRGFAVVAEEIRILADDCANSVVDIVKTTRDMDELVKAVVEKTTDSLHMIQDGTDVVMRTNDTFHKINSIIVEINDAINNIGESIADVERVATDMAASTQEQSANTESVLEDCEQAMNISECFNSKGEEMAAAGQQLKELSGALASMVEQFKVD